MFTVSVSLSPAEIPMAHPDPPAFRVRPEGSRSSLQLTGTCSPCPLTCFRKIDPWVDMRKGVLDDVSHYGHLG